MYTLHPPRLTQLVKRLNKLPAIVRLCHAKPPGSRFILFGSEALIYRKFIEVNEWYTRVIGLDEVKKYQDRVIELQEKLMRAQDVRRTIAAALTDSRSKSNELQERINKTRRSDDLQGYLELMREETEVLKTEKVYVERLNVSDREERDLLTAFTNAIRDSHEKQRAQIEYTKYFGIVLSIIGSFLAFTFARIRNYDIKRIISESIEKSMGENKTTGGENVVVNDADVAKHVSLTVERAVKESMRYASSVAAGLTNGHDKQLSDMTKANVSFGSMLKDVSQKLDRLGVKISSVQTDLGNYHGSIVKNNDELRKSLRNKPFVESVADDDRMFTMETVRAYKPIIVWGTLGFILLMWLQS